MLINALLTCIYDVIQGKFG